MSDDLQTFLDARNSSILAESHIFNKSEVYIFRFILRTYFKEQPSTGANTFINKIVSFLSEDLDKYYILGVTLKKLEPFQSVKVHGASLLLGTTDRTVFTDDASWILDVVIRPAESQTSWPNPSRWKERISEAARAWGGWAPVVDVVGVANMPLSWPWNTAHFDHVYAWWNQRQPIYYVAACTKKQLTDKDFKGECPSVSNTAFNATSSFTQGLIGEDGLGFAYGLSDYPDPLKPINVKDKSSSIVIPGNDKKDEKDKDTGGSNGNGKGGDASQYLIFGAFAVVGYFLWQKYLKEML